MVNPLSGFDTRTGFIARILRQPFDVPMRSESLPVIVTLDPAAYRFPVPARAFGYAEGFGYGEAGYGENNKHLSGPYTYDTAFDYNELEPA